MVEAAYFWAAIVDESYRDSRVAAVICAAGGIVVLMAVPVILVLANCLSKCTRD